MHPPPPHAAASGRQAEEILGLEEDEDVPIQNVLSEGHFLHQNCIGSVDFGEDSAANASRVPVEEKFSQ